MTVSETQRERDSRPTFLFPFRKGFYVDEDNGIGVTESVLKQTSPLRLNSHLLLIEAMMEASNKNCITIEASVKAVRETGAKFR